MRSRGPFAERGPMSDLATSLVGDGIENPFNARALMDAASMFGLTAAFRDTRDLAEQWDASLTGPIPIVTTSEIVDGTPPIVAVENGTGSTSLFGMSVKPPSVIVVGNERRGIARDILKAARRTVHIPTAGRGVNTLNVAAAAAVALYFLTGHRGGGRAKPSAHLERRRPALLVMAPTDHVEAGSSLRTAAAFGWRSVAVDDRQGVWFDTPRAQRTEGRAAARSHRAELRVLNTGRTDPGFDQVLVAGSFPHAPFLHQVKLTGGPPSAVVIPDEEGIDLASEPWARLAPDVRFARLDLPPVSSTYRFRLPASIVMAEVARQLGIRTRDARSERFAERRYHSRLDLAQIGSAHALGPDDLLAY